MWKYISSGKILSARQSLKWTEAEWCPGASLLLPQLSLAGSLPGCAWQRAHPQARWGRHSGLWAPVMPRVTSAGTQHMERNLAMKKGCSKCGGGKARNSELEVSPFWVRIQVLKTTTHGEYRLCFICYEVKHVINNKIKQLSQWLYTEWLL